MPVVYGPHYIPAIAYGLATGVVFARVGSRQHFPRDVMAGSAMGRFTGDYVYGRRHNRDHVTVGPRCNRDQGGEVERLGLSSAIIAGRRWQNRSRPYQTPLFLLQLCPAGEPGLPKLPDCSCV
jgi:hypothetical protein